MLRIACTLFAFALPTVAAAQAPQGPVHAYADSVTPQEWDLFAQKFLQPDGRVVDTANGGISHSESQGYGMMLAWMAGDKADFARIWAFTERELRIRNDGLFAWKWSPNDRPNVKDSNNATDGDVLIAYALEAAGNAWGNADYTEAATQIKEAVSADMLLSVRGRSVMIPGETGFDKEDEVILNPSYWVQEAFTQFEATAPQQGWAAVRDSLPVVMEDWATSGAGALGPEWLVMRKRSGEVSPSTDLGSGFGYNALRIPLYAVRDGKKRDLGMARLTQQVTTKDGDLLILNADGSVKEQLSEPGYRALAGLLRCAILRSPDGEIPAFAPTDYYPAVLHLLSLSAARVKAPECVIGS